MRKFTTMLMFICAAALAFVMPLRAAHAIHDLNVAHPSGAYSLLSNPASVIYTRHLSVQAAVGIAGKGGMTSQLLAYLEPDTGLGAGALYWHSMSGASGNRQEFGYILARQVTPNVYYGLTIKQLNEGGVRVWAADIGLLFHDLSRLRIGLTAHNFVGQSAMNPLQVAGAVSYDVTPHLAVSLFASMPAANGATDADVGVAVDVEPIPDVLISLARIRSLRSSQEYWLGRLVYTVQSITFDASVRVDGKNDQRFTVGVLFRF